MLRQWPPFFLITIIYAERQQLIHHSDHTSTLASWQMDVIQRERPPTVLLLLRRRKKNFWPCKMIGCIKQAQSSHNSLCKRCYNEFVRNQPTINLTQGAENLTSLGDHVNNEGRCAGINKNTYNENAICYNPTVSLQRNATLIYRFVAQGPENLASLNDRVNNERTRAGINKNISYDNAICFNNPRGSLQRNLTLIVRFGAENNTSVLNKCGTSVEQDQCDEVAFDNIFVHDAEHAAEQCAVVDVANVHP